MVARHWEAEAAGPGDSGAFQRVRRSDELLAKLYVVDSKPKRLARRSIDGMIAVSVLSVLVFVATVLLKYNTFVTMREEALARQANYEVAIQRRHNLSGNLLRLTLSHASLEHAVFGHAADKRAEEVDAGRGGEAAGPAKQSPGDGVPPADGGFGVALGKLLAIVEQYPNIQSVDTYKHMMSSLIDSEDRIAERRETYNTAVAGFNAEITRWPWDYLAVVTGFKRMDYFHEMAQGDAPVITSEMIQKLLPLAPDTGAAK